MFLYYILGIVFRRDKLITCFDDLEKKRVDPRVYLFKKTALPLFLYYISGIVFRRDKIITCFDNLERKQVDPRVYLFLKNTSLPLLQ